MKRGKLVWGCVFVVCGAQAPVGADQGGLTLDAALRHVAERGSAAAAARLRVEEGRARVRGARAARENPVLESAFGDRADSGALDLEVGFRQPLDLFGRRGRRIAAAEAGLLRETAAAEAALVDVLRQVGLAFHRALAAEERRRVAEAAERQGAELERIAARRLEAGDVASLDLNLAASSAARARSERRAAAASEALARGSLRVWLDFDPAAPLAVSGPLRPRPVPALDTLLAAAASRADIRAAEAEAREAAAEAEAGRTMRWPEVTPSVRYERDDGTSVFWGGLAVSLPLWNRGQEASGPGAVRASRLREAAAALRRAARHEVESAYEAFGHRLAALEEIERASGRLAENEILSRRGYEEGQIGLAELLLAGREALETRALHLERYLEAADTEIELLARAGVLR
jgi:cobalt-zinc-cadmium efflux system outer membrane protein